MPNWKKLIVSGSDANLNSLNVTTSITGSDVKIDDWGSISASLANLTDTTPDGSGTANYITKWSDSDTITDSIIKEENSGIGIGGNVQSGFKLDITGNSVTRGNVYLSEDIWHFGANDFNVRTSGTSNIRLHTNSSERIRIDSSGNVGIGTTNPGSTLPTDSETASKVLQLTGVSGNTGDTAVLLRSSDNSSGLDLWHNASSGDSYIDNRFNAAQGDTIFRVKTAGTPLEALRIAGDGKVGVGTPSPSEKLDVAGSIVVSTGQSLKWGAGATRITGIDGSYISLYPNNSEKVRFLANGNVLIGTTTDNGDKLTVAGNIHASGSGNEIITDQIFRAAQGTMRFRKGSNTWDAMMMSSNGKLELANGGANDRGEIYLHADHGSTPRAGVVTFENESQGTSFLFTDTDKRLKFHTSDPGEDDSLGEKIFYNNFPDDATFGGDLTVNGAITLSESSNEIIKSNGSIRLNIDSNNDQTDRVFIVSTGANSEIFRVTETGYTVAQSTIKSQAGILALGNDVTLFRDGVNILRTDDAFHANNSVHVGGDGKVYDRANTSNYIELADTVNISTDTSVTGDLTVTGTITAQEFHTEFVSASVLYESGSTKFGDTLDDNHDFTGSINLLGSINIDSGSIQHDSNDISTWHLNINQVYTGGEDTAPEALFFKPDGTKMYILGRTGDDIDEYALSTAWDVSTATYTDQLAGLNASPSSEGSPHGMFISPNGLEVYIVGHDRDQVIQWTMSTAWDISTATYTREQGLTDSGGTYANPHGIHFKPDGTRFWVVGQSEDLIQEYTLSTAWDVSTLSLGSSLSLINFYTSLKLQPPGEHNLADIGSTEDLFFSEDGYKVWVVDNSFDTIIQLNLSTAWDVTTASYDSKAARTTPYQASVEGLYVKESEGKAFTCSTSGDHVRTYNIGGVTLENNNDSSIGIKNGLNVKGDSVFNGIASFGHIYATSGYYYGSFNTFNNTSLAHTNGGDVNILDATTTADSKVDVQTNIYWGANNISQSLQNNQEHNFNLQRPRNGATTRINIGLVRNDDGVENFHNGIVKIKSLAQTFDHSGSLNVGRTLQVEGKGDLELFDLGGTTVFLDNFTESSTTALESHTPDTGAGWTKVFDDGNTNTWNVIGGTGVAQIDASDTDDGIMYLADTTPSSTNYEVKVDFKRRDSGDDTFSIIIKYKDANNYYALQWSTSYSTYCRLIRVEGGSIVNIQNTFGNGVMNSTTDNLASGLKLRYIDGKLMVWDIDPTGYAAFRGSYEVTTDFNDGDGGTYHKVGMALGDLFGGTLDGTTTWKIDKFEVKNLSAASVYAAATTHYIENGNVGIGTTSPSEKLEVDGNIKSKRITLSHSGYAGYINQAGDFGGGPLYIRNQGQNHDINFQGNKGGTTSTSLHIDGLTHNIGIGTTSPSAKLNVVGTGTQLGTSGYYYNTFLKDNTNSGVLLGGNNTDNGVGFLAGINELAFLTYGTSWGERMRIKSSGQVQLTDYGSGTFTGTVQSTLGIDSSGNIIEFTGGGGGSVSAITSGADTRVAYFNGSDSLEGSDNFTWNDTTLHIKGDSDISSDFLIIEDSDPTAGSSTPRIQFRSGSTAIGQIRGHDTRGLQLGGGTSTQAMTLRPNGDVGIGTTSPSSNLHVHGAGGTGVVTQIKVTQADDGAGHPGANAILQSSGWGEAFLMLAGHQISAAGGDMNITSTTDLALQTGGTNTRMFIDGSTGNVGIGTTSPGRQLEIKRPLGSSAGMIRISDEASSAYWDFGHTNDSDGNDFQFWYNNGSSTSKYFHIGNDGNVGIGTTSFTSKLHVEATGTSNIRTLLLNGVGAGTTGIRVARPGAFLDIANDLNSTQIVAFDTANKALIYRQRGSGGGGNAFPAHQFTGDANTSGAYPAILGAKGGATGAALFRGQQADNTTVFTVEYDGKVGIGTASPSVNLDIEDANGVTIDLNSSSGDSQFRFQDAGTTKWAIGRDNTQQNFVFSNSAGLSSDNVLTLEHATGNVGIGTSNPGYKLDVAGDIQNNGVLRRGGNVFIKSTGSETMIGPAGSGIISFHNSATMTAGDETVRIDANGNLLLNNTSAGARLDIREDTNYAIRAEDATGHYFRVNTGGDVDMRGDLVVQGTITAQQFHSEFVSASIIYDSGSTKFGDTVDDNHDFTGSLEVRMTDTAASGKRSFIVSGSSGVRLQRKGDGNGWAMEYGFNANDGTDLKGFGGYGTGNSYLQYHYIGGTFNNPNMAILAGGNVGIGTASPTYKLEVNGTARIHNRLTFGGNVNNFIEGTGSSLDFKSNGEYYFKKGANTHLTILSGGNVGIGTTNPGYKLDVLGTIRGTGTTSRLILDNTQGQSFNVYAWSTGVNLYNNSSTNPNVYFGRDAGTANNFYFTRNGTNFTMRVDTANERVGIGTTSMGYTLDVESDDNIIANFESTTNKGAIRISDDDTVAYISAENGRIGFGTSPQLSTANLTVLTSNNNVGIGSTSPTYKLSVSGGIVAGGKVTYTKSAGSLDTTGYAVAGLTTSSNGQSAGFTFTCFGHTGGYQKIVYSCYNASGTWNTVKVIDEGTNQLDIEASANGTTITFTFKSRSGTMSYTPRVTVEATGTAINNTYA